MRTGTLLLTTVSPVPKAVTGMEEVIIKHVLNKGIG